MTLAVLGDGASACAGWDDLDLLLTDFEQDGAADGPRVVGPSSAGETHDGALAVSFKLKPGERRTATFFLTWYFPNASHGQGEWGGDGNRYCNRWTDALDVARYLHANLGDLTAQTRLYHDTLYDSNLPRWLLDRLGSQTAILRSQTCFWTKDGYFGGWEGCSASKGCCLGNCSHVWHYAQSHARLFPDIGRAMREQELSHQAPDGGVPHRQVPGCEPATDGQLGTVLEAYREHLMSPDRKWLDAQWPEVKKAMDYVIDKWDADHDGTLSGRQWNTLDDALGGSTSWMGTLYLAALSASERMARLEGDRASAGRYHRIRTSGERKQDETLFNGEYYIQIPDPEPRKDYLTGCHIDQALGQWWAHQLDLGWIYPPEHVRSALRSLVTYNYRTDFRGVTQAPRKFVADEDAGMQMITWPKGGRPDPEHCIYYGDEVMTGFEYSAAAAMIQAGMLDEGLSVVKAVYDRYDGRLRTGLTPGDNASWGYSGNPFGDDECGKFYARAMSVWSVLLSCQGYVYDGPAGRIGFRPVWRPEDHASFFTCAEGWGLFTQKRSKSGQTERIEVRYGKLDLNEIAFELAEGLKPREVTVKLSGRTLRCTHDFDGNTLTIRFPSTVTLRAGKAAEVEISICSR
jgi:uncharacterized protein (DUF608 family)